MTNWKDHERACAELIGGQRYPANQGGRVDVESPNIVAQCKEKRVCPLAEQVRLVIEMEKIAAAKGKVGVVFVRHKSGRGNPSPGLIVMTHGAFFRLMTLAAKGEIFAATPAPPGAARPSPGAATPTGAVSTTP